MNLGIPATVLPEKRGDGSPHVAEALGNDDTRVNMEDRDDEEDVRKGTKRAPDVCHGCNNNHTE